MVIVQMYRYYDHSILCRYIRYHDEWYNKYRYMLTTKAYSACGQVQQVTHSQLLGSTTTYYGNVVKDLGI